MLWPLIYVALTGLPVASVTARETPRLVVVLYPDGNDGRPGSVQFDRGVRSVLLDSTAPRIEISCEFLDINRTSHPEFQEQLAEFLEHKYSNRQPAVVITGLAPALDFALKYRDRVFTRAPVVYGAIDSRELADRTLPEDAVGASIKMDLAATLETALRLHRNTERVVVVSGQSAFDRKWEAEARRTFQALESRTSFEYLSGLRLADVEQRLSMLPSRTVVYYLHIFEDPDRSGLVPAEVLRRIALTSNAPIYGHVDSYLGRGIVGGRVFSWEAEGRTAARTALQIISGATPQSVAAEAVSTNQDVFDWRELQRWGISESSLPPGSVLRNKNPTFWDRYKWHILGLVTLCLLQGLTIVAMLVQRFQRRRAEQRFRQAVDAAPVGMLMVNAAGRIVLANSATEQLFGYTKQELIGRPAELLMSERWPGLNGNDKSDNSAVRLNSTMSSVRDPMGRRKDGGEFPIEIGLSPLTTDLGPFVLASILDVTDRKRAEQRLLRSQEELQILTGRLLTAQEEERRRIARELHDDVNQRLALLSVRLDMLRQTANVTPSLETPLAELSTRLKELSTAIHDLSHQLHPFKLDQMGLIAALSSLCEEVESGHQLKVNFTHAERLGELTGDSAVCLYRVAQEALRNIVKHSRATAARVELKSRDKVISLTISDDGVGLVSDERGHGLGLVSIRERLRLIDGEMMIRSDPESGTRLEAMVPLRCQSCCENAEHSLRRSHQEKTQ